MRTLTPEQVRYVLDDLANRDSWAVVPILLLVTTGIRRSELCGLRFGDLDLERGLLRIQRTVHHLARGKMVTREPKTRRSRRTVALDSHTVAMLRVHRSECERAAELFGRRISERDPVFAPADQYGKGEGARPWRGDTYSRLWWRTARRLGIQARLHDLRHTSASLMLAAGVNVQAISARLGHGDVGFTLNTYSHRLPGADAEAAEKLAAILGNGPKAALPAG